MTVPRELTYLVPADVLAAVENAVAALETHGPVVSKALRQLARATTLAWKAVNLVRQPMPIQIPSVQGRPASVRPLDAVGHHQMGAQQRIAFSGRPVVEADASTPCPATCWTPPWPRRAPRCSSR
jgi:hypothetical protein